jgi:uncharacterized protein YjbI with pentapeptide repeats
MSDDEALLKTKLIAELGSRDEMLVLNALHHLAKQGWIYDGSLRGAKVEEAQWHGVMLPYVDLCGVDLSEACVGEAFLGDANLQGAMLIGTDFTDAILLNANLQGANLTGAILYETCLAGTRLIDACLTRANLTHTDLSGADLCGANFDYAVFDENTVLPDGTYWSPTCDLRRFTDPTYPDFWQPAHK